MKAYDLVVIGTGVAATKVARTCRGAGWNVAVVDSRPYGGTCMLRGCDPKKLLWGVAKTVDQAKRYGKDGVKADALSLSWPDLIRFKQSFVAPLPDAVEHTFRQAGIETLHGQARFAGPTKLEISGEIVEADHIVIAAGSRPAPLPISGAEHLLSSDDLLDLEHTPQKVAFVGGGYISFEFAHVLARAGVGVTILHGDSRPLAHFDHDLVDRLLDASRRASIDVRLDNPVAGVTKTNAGFRVSCGDSAATIEVDAVVHGAGRVPDTEALDLDAGGLEHDHTHLRLTPQMASVSNPAVYAAGDAAATGPMLTPVAELEAEVVAHNLLHPDAPRAPDYAGVPSAVFTIPVLAAAGLTEEQAQAQNLAFDVHHADITSWYSARRVKAETAAYKILIEKPSGRILGAQLIGPGAEETINLFALAMRSGLAGEVLRSFVPAYPSEAANLEYMLA